MLGLCFGSVILLCCVAINVGLVQANSSAAAAIISAVAADVQAELATGGLSGADVAAYGAVVGALVASTAVTASDKLKMVQSLADTIASLDPAPATVAAAGAVAPSSGGGGDAVSFAQQEIGVMIEQLRGVGGLLTDNYAAVAAGMPDDSGILREVWVEFGTMTLTSFGPLFPPFFFFLFLPLLACMHACYSCSCSLPLTPCNRAVSPWSTSRCSISTD